MLRSSCTFSLVVVLGSLASLGVRAEAPRCASHVPERQLLWGELHVHTGISMDAWMMDTRLRPDDAYRFARGEPVMLRPLDAKGLGTVPFRIQRPLDFAAVTDHARNFGGVRLCTTPGSLPYDTAACQRYRQPFSATSLDEGQADIFERAELLRSTAVCGQDMMRCRLAAGDAWQETITAAERHNEGAPGCGFTAFVAYEYTLTPEETKIHRNVIFRGATVPSLPISAIDEPTPLGLWRQLQRQCIDAGTGCDVLAIPHNSNLSNGQMFTIEYPPGSTPKQQAELARLRAEMEPVVEIMQMKGDSECRNGMWNVLGNDELCTFEKLRVQPDPPDCRDGTGKGALGQKGCVSRLDYARYALIEGLREADRLGVNPYAFGMTAATDIHTGTPAPVDEWAGEPASQMRAAPGMNPGGIAAIWAQENSRESIFAALRRREVYGTSGPRISARFFGGWSYPEDLCGSHDLVTRGYAGGVPMGAQLTGRPDANAAPIFVVSALRDPGTADHPGTPLQRVQIIKGWADEEGVFHQDVHDVAAAVASDADVDPATCRPRGAGADSLCGVWRDPDFDPQRRAVYYARVVENPSCRYDGWVCVRAEQEARPAFCGATPQTIQERAWTSPIWYTPGRESLPAGRSHGS